MEMKYICILYLRKVTNILTKIRIRNFCIFGTLKPSCCVSFDMPDIKLFSSMSAKFSQA